MNVMEFRLVCVFNYELKRDAPALFIQSPQPDCSHILSSGASLLETKSFTINLGLNNKTDKTETNGQMTKTPSNLKFGLFSQEYQQTIARELNQSVDAFEVLILLNQK